jgi:mRNA interferase HicA
MTAFKAREVISILQKLHYIQKRQTGSHMIMYNPKTKKTLPVPMHVKDIKKGLLKSIIKQAESTEKEFIKLK